MSRTMSGDQSPGLEQRLVLRRAFLEEADFSRLRRESEEHLTQGGRCSSFSWIGPALAVGLSKWLWKTMLCNVSSDGFAVALFGQRGRLAKLNRCF